MTSGLTRIKFSELLINSYNCIVKQAFFFFKGRNHCWSLSDLNLRRLQEKRSHFKHSLHSPHCRHTTHQDTHLLCWRVKMSTLGKNFLVRGRVVLKDESRPALKKPFVLWLILKLFRIVIVVNLYPDLLFKVHIYILERIVTDFMCCL